MNVWFEILQLSGRFILAVKFKHLLSGLPFTIASIYGPPTTP